MSPVLAEPERPGIVDEEQTADPWVFDSAPVAQELLAHYLSIVSTGHQLVMTSFGVWLDAL
jgi:hypothetical protein